MLLLKLKFCLILMINNHIHGDNKNKILGGKLVEETIGVDKVKGEAEEGSTIKENNAHIAIK